jgi:hypothetical protein
MFSVLAHSQGLLFHRALVGCKSDYSCRHHHTLLGFLKEHLHNRHSPFSSFPIVNAGVDYSCHHHVRIRPETTEMSLISVICNGRRSTNYAE